MKKYIYIILPISIILLLIFTYFQRVPLSNSTLLTNFKHGDIVFVSGTSWRATVLRMLGNPDYTHVGILIVDKDGESQILQAIPKYDDINNKSGVVLTPIDHFFSDVSAYEIIRHPNILISNKLDDYIGKAFDNKFNRFDAEKIYCTELIDYILRDNGLAMTPKKYDYIWPNTLATHLVNIGFKEVQRSK